MNRNSNLPLVRLMFATVLTMSLSGCAVQVGYDLPGAITADSSQMPKDVQALSATVEGLLRGQSGSAIEGVTFTSPGPPQIAEDEFRYQGFNLKKTELVRYAQRPGNEDGRVVAGKLGFEDSIGRRIEVLYYADYVYKDGGITIADLRAAPLYSTFPEAIMFLLPARAVVEAGGLPQTHSEIIAFASEHAVDWTTVSGVTGQTDNYIIVTFLMDRVSPSAQVELKISDTKIGNAGYKNSSKYLDILGWRIAVAPGSFNLGNASFFVKVVFQPGDEVGFGGRYKRVIGLYPLDLKLARQSLAEGS